MKFRVFTNDVGPNAYSCLMSLSAKDQNEANRKARRIAGKLDCKAVALPESRRELWPDGQTGLLPAESKRLVVSY